MFKHRVGELMRQRGVTYSQLSRRADIGMQTCRMLYENPYYEMNTGTLYRCSKFFGVPITDLLVETDEVEVA